MANPLRRRFALPVACVVSILLPAHDAAAQGNARPLTEAYNAAGQDLLRQFAAKPGNIVFSPYSIGTAMAMALAGARGGTEREMLTVLRHRLERAEIDAANADILAALNKHGAAPPTPAPAARLLTANALMLTRHGSLVSEPYAALLRDKYAAEIFHNATLAEINGWVARKTEGKIDKILDNLDRYSAAVLLNAVYFKSRWADPFDKRMTKDESFHLAPSRQVRVPTMNRTGLYALAARPGYRALRLPYVVRALGMVIVLPDAVDGLTAAGQRIDTAELSELLTALRGAHRLVALALPRFKAEYKADLIPSFRQAGLTLALDHERADFSGITGKPVPPVELYISQIVHRAMIEVSEESTEAAAATAVEAARPASAAPPPKPEAFRVDRPFQFYLVDEASGAILFQGRIADPRQATH